MSGRPKLRVLDGGAGLPPPSELDAAIAAYSRRLAAAQCGRPQVRTCRKCGVEKPLGAFRQLVCQGIRLFVCEECERPGRYNMRRKRPY